MSKTGYFEKLKSLLDEYRSIFIVTVDNVSSQQMHEIRHSLRDRAVVLMGKNTMVRIFRVPIELIILLNVDTGSPRHQGLPCR